MLAAPLLSLALAACATTADPAQTMMQAQPAPSLTAAGYTATDTLFAQPYIDAAEWRDAPVRHFYVHGGFTGTDTRFSYYLPAAEHYKAGSSSTPPRCR